MATNSSTSVVAYYGRVLGFVYQVVGDVGLATQATATACLRYARAGGSEVDLWRITVQVLREYLARGFTVQPLAPDGQQARVLIGLQQLGPEQRMALLLRYHERLTVPDTALALGITEAALRIMLSEARHEFTLRWRQAHDAV